MTQTLFEVTVTSQAGSPCCRLPGALFVWEPDPAGGLRARVLQPGDAVTFDDLLMRQATCQHCLSQSILYPQGHPWSPHAPTWMPAWFPPF